MGNRAFIYFKGQDTGIYLHWNGGRDSVQGFLSYCQLRGFRFNDYGVARMAQIVGNFFGGDLSVGVQSTENVSPSQFNPGDNGVYIVDNWEIVGRYPRDIVEQDNYTLIDMMKDINKAQPVPDRVKVKDITRYVKERQAKE